MTNHMETETPGRSFEPLDWYREAVGSNRMAAWSPARLGEWLKGAEFLIAHISVFAVGIVALIVINLLRSPTELWVDRVGAAWALLLIIHGAAVALIRAIEFLEKEDSEALQAVPNPEWRQAPASWPRTVTMVPPDGADPQGATPFPAPNAQRPAPASPQRLARPADGNQPQPLPPGWSAWGQSVEQPPQPDEPKASWKEAATWLTSGGGRRQAAQADRPHSDPPASNGSSSR